MKTGVRIGLVLFSMAVLQRGVLSQVRIAGVSADALLLVAIAAGMVSGPDRGAVVGFAAGLTFDLLVSTPFGMSALIYCVVGNIAGRVQGYMVRSSWWFRPVLAAAAGACAVVAMGLVGHMLDLALPSTRRMVSIILVTAVFNALFVGVFSKMMRWAMCDSDVAIARW